MAITYKIKVTEFMPNVHTFLFLLQNFQLLIYQILKLYSPPKKDIYIYSYVKNRYIYTLLVGK